MDKHNLNLIRKRLKRLLGKYRGKSLLDDLMREKTIEREDTKFIKEPDRSRIDIRQ